MTSVGGPFGERLTLLFDRKKALRGDEAADFNGRGAGLDRGAQFLERLRIAFELQRNLLHDGRRVFAFSRALRLPPMSP